MGINEAIAERLERIAKLQQLLGADTFRAVSNERAARAIEGHSVDLASLVDDRAALEAIDGVGKRTTDKIIEFVRTGTIKELEDLEAQVPAGVVELLNVPGLGPKTAATLWKQGGVTSLAELRAAIDDGRLMNLPRMGAKAIEKLAASLNLAEQAGKRLALGLAFPVAERIVAAMRTVAGVGRVAYAGSLRRGRETVGDLDILITAADPKAASEAFRTLPGVQQVLAAGDLKSSVRMAIGVDLGRWATDAEAKKTSAAPGLSIQVDLRVIPEDGWGAALMYFTGSKEHNVELRERALKMGLTLNEYGIFPEPPGDKAKGPPQARGVKPVASRTEEDVYAALGLAWIPPEMREDRGELQIYTKEKGSPRPVELADIKAELHAHTTASDGRMSIEELATRARECGFHTIAVTDHSRSSAIAGGLSVDRLLEHVEAVREVNGRVRGITILAGSEVDILADGRLDYDDDVLAQLDVVVASPHAALTQDPEKATARLVRAVSNPYVNILGHPTGRLIDRRNGLSPDMAKVIAAAKANDVALEINAHWLRLDLRDTHVRAAVDAGCLIAIDCDVHTPDDFSNLIFGVMTARRGWVMPSSCVNTWDADRLHTWLRRGRGRG